MTETANENEISPRGFPWWRVLGIALLAVILTTAGTVWLIKTYIFPSPFTPVTLSTQEQQVLSTKLQRLDVTGAQQPELSTDAERSTSGSVGSAQALEPEPYSEEQGSRQIVFSERELNALLAKNTDLARKLAIDLSGDLMSAKLLIPVDEDFPVLGGQTIRVRAGMGLSYANGRPVVVLQGISVMGVPLPNAWLGGLKHVDLVKEYESDRGFWQAFVKGVGDLRVNEGELTIKLKE